MVFFVILRASLWLFNPLYFVSFIQCSRIVFYVRDRLSKTMSVVPMERASRRWFQQRLLDSLMVECWLWVHDVPGSIPSQGPRHTKDATKMVPVYPLLSTEHLEGNTGSFSLRALWKIDSCLISPFVKYHPNKQIPNTQNLQISTYRVLEIRGQTVIDRKPIHVHIFLN